MAEVGDEVRCPSCDAAAPATARWCGSCGQVLASRPTEPDDADQADKVAEAAALPVLVPMVPAPTDRPGGFDDSGPQDPPTQKLWRTSRIVAAVTVVAVLAGMLVVSRGRDGNLHDLAPIGSGDADGRDGARTGRVAGDAPREPTRIVWSEAVRRPRSEENVYGQLQGDYITIYREDRLDVLARSDGSLLWSAQGYSAGLVDGGILVEEQPTGLSLRDADTGIVRWRRLPPPGSQVQVTDGHLFESAGQNPVSSLLRGASGLRRLDPATGQIMWEVSFDGDPPWVSEVFEGRLVAQQYISLDDDHYQQVHTVLDVATGEVLVRREGRITQPVHDGLGLRVPDDSMVLLPADRALLVEDGKAGIWSLDPFRRIQDAPALDGRQLFSAADLIAAIGQNTTDNQFVAGQFVVHDRATLKTLWQGQGDWIDMYPVRLDPVRGLAVVQRNNKSEFVDPRTGEVRGEQDWSGPIQVAIDTEGTLESGTQLRYLSHDGTVAWTLGDHEQERPDASTLRLVDQRLVGTIGTSWMIHELTGSQTRTVDTRGSQEGEIYAGPAPLLRMGDGLVAIVRERVRWSESARAVVWRWSKDMGGPVTAAVMGDGTLHVATDEVLRSLDPTDGSTISQRGLAGLRTLTIAGDKALIGLVDESKEGCVLPRDAGCTVTATRVDPDDLTVRWTSTPIESACAAATVGGNVIGIPTNTGATFLSATDGSLVGTWTAARSRCTELAFDGRHFLAGGDEGLLVGQANGEPNLVATASAVTTAPVLVGGQALVGLQDPAVAAIDLAASKVAWSFPVPATLLAPPVVSGDSIFVLLASGQIARLG